MSSKKEEYTLFISLPIYIVLVIQAFYVDQGLIIHHGYLPLKIILSLKSKAISHAHLDLAPGPRQFDMVTAPSPIASKLWIILPPDVRDAS